MKGLPEGELGSWSWAVVTSDGVWQTRGHFSKNGSFIINPLTFLLFSVFFLLIYITQPAVFPPNSSLFRFVFLGFICYWHWTVFSSTIASWRSTWPWARFVWYPTCTYKRLSQFNSVHFVAEFFTKRFINDKTIYNSYINKMKK